MPRTRRSWAAAGSTAPSTRRRARACSRPAGGWAGAKWRRPIHRLPIDQHGGVPVPDRSGHPCRHRGGARIPEHPLISGGGYLLLFFSRGSGGLSRPSWESVNDQGSMQASAQPARLTDNSPLCVKLIRDSGCQGPKAIGDRLSKPELGIAVGSSLNVDRLEARATKSQRGLFEVLRLDPYRAATRRSEGRLEREGIDIVEVYAPLPTTAVARRSSLPQPTR